MVMDKENLFNAPPHFTSQTHHELAALTRRFSRSASIQQPLYILKEKRGFSGTTESGLGWPVSTHSTRPPSPPPFVKTDEDSWDLIYAAAEQVARMKMKMRMNMAAAAVVANKNNTGFVGASHAVTHFSPWGTTDGNEFFRQPQFCQNRGCNESCRNNGGGGGVRSPSFPHSAWPPPPPPPQLPPKPCNMSVMKPAVAGGSGGGCDGGGGATAGKRECAGTGVFLPRRYCNNPPESRKRQACSSATLPARTIPSSSLVPITPPINGGFIPHYGGQQRRSSNVHGGVMDNPEVLLPQEWTY